MNNKLNVFKFGFHECSWRHPFESIGQFFINCYYAWQRATKGYCDWDLWDLDIFYRQLFINSLQDFKERTIGHPANMTEEEWNNYLTEMIEHFKKSETWLEKDDEINDSVDDIIEAQKEKDEHLKQGLEMLYNHFGSLWI